MSIYIYRRASSTSARALSEALQNGRRVRHAEYLYRAYRRDHDKIVFWGEYLNHFSGLNNVPLQNKYQDALKLREAGVPTVEVSLERPVRHPVGPPPLDPAIEAFRIAQERAVDFASLNRFDRGAIFRAGIEDLSIALGRLGIALAEPAPVQPEPLPQAEWLGRSFSHVGGNDLLNPLPNPNYYVKKETLIREFRVHSFLGKSIRAGAKTPREGVEAHPWIRSWDGGWRLSYDGNSVRQRHRDLAHQSITALGLQFGAVDIGEREDGSLLVLEVNRAPGLEGGTIQAYANAISQWAGGQA